MFTHQTDVKILAPVFNGATVCALYLKENVHISAIITLLHHNWALKTWFVK